MIGEDTFTVSLLKTFITKSIENKHNSPLNPFNPLNRKEPKFSILTKFKEHYFQSKLSLVEGMLSFGFAEINFTITSDIQQCKLLKFGDQNWQNGELKIIGILKMYKTTQDTKMETELLFCPEDLSNNESNES